MIWQNPSRTIPSCLATAHILNIISNGQFILAGCSSPQPTRVMGPRSVWVEWRRLSSGLHSSTRTHHRLLQTRRFARKPWRQGTSTPAYLRPADWNQANERLYACLPVCCALSLTPNSLSLIGCVILGGRQRGPLKGSWGRREPGATRGPYP